MTLHVAYVAIGTNLGDRARNVGRAIAALSEAGTILRQSSIYRTVPWGRLDQPEFYNAVVALETPLPPRRLLGALQSIERRLGRTAGERWGPRVIDLDLLLYDDERIDEEGLNVPHEAMSERAFVLVPLAELDERFVVMRDALHESQLAGVVRLDESENARVAAVLRENAASMSSERSEAIIERVRALATFLTGADTVAVRIAREGEEIELTRRVRRAPQGAPLGDRVAGEAAPLLVDTIKSDLVGTFHLNRPLPAQGEIFEGDRELGYIEALGIRTPVRSLGGGRLVAVATSDESPVEYGQALFSIART